MNKILFAPLPDRNRKKGIILQVVGLVLPLAAVFALNFSTLNEVKAETDKAIKFRKIVTCLSQIVYLMVLIYITMRLF